MRKEGRDRERRKTVSTVSHMWKPRDVVDLKTNHLIADS